MNFVPVCDSRKAAEMLNQRHADTLKHIDRLYCSQEFRAENYKESSYKDKRGRDHRMLLISKSGMILLLMESGYRKSAAFKIYLIECMHAMEEIIEDYSHNRKE